MKKTLATITALPAALFLLTACADFKFSDAEMTRADLKAREEGIRGWPVSERRLDVIIAETPSLAHLKK